MTASRRDWQRPGCAALLGAIVAFPAGLLFAGRETVRSEAPGSPTATAPALGEAETRNAYSPKVLSDPYVLQRHREIAEALETSCRETGEACAEAEQARRYLLEREPSRTR